MIYIWFDTFRKGGLEKSLVDLVCYLSSQHSHSISILTLSSSCYYLHSHISDLDLPRVQIKSFKSYFQAFTHIRHILKSDTARIISFKNHAPLVLFLKLSLVDLRPLILRHSNPLYAPLLELRARRLSKSLQQFHLLRSSIYLWAKTILTTIIYSQVHYHLANSLESIVYIESILGRHCYLFVNTKYLPIPSTLEYTHDNITQTRNLRILWFGRSSSQKDIDTLSELLSILSTQSHLLDDVKLLFDIYTSSPAMLLKSDCQTFGSLQFELNIYPWADSSINLSRYDIYLHTSRYEGLSNSFMVVQHSSIPFIVAPLTSTGFFENHNTLTLYYRPSSIHSLLSVLLNTVRLAKRKFVTTYSSSQLNYLTFNGEFIDFISTLP